MRYVVQEHYARRHHFDLRLEKDGVLKSWAIPKEIPLKKGVKRLAVQVEDHHLSYANFEGIIPKGFYGAGEVKIWDKGKYKPIEWKKDKIVVEIRGEKVKGKYCLVRLKRSEKNWIIFKIE